MASFKSDKIIKQHLTFGNLCYLYQANAKKTLKIKTDDMSSTYSDGNNQIEIIKSMMDLCHNAPVRKRILGNFDKAIASYIFNSKYTITALAMEISNCSREEIKNNILTYMKANMVDWENFVSQLQELVKSLLDEDEKQQLLYDHQSSAQSEAENEIEFVANCLYYVVYNDNEIKVADEEAMMDGIEEPFSLFEDDPYTRGEKKEFSASTAVEIHLFASFLKEAPYHRYQGYIVYHNFDDVVDFIVDHNLIITKIETLLGTLHIYAKKTAYTLRKLRHEEVPQAFAYIDSFNDTFKPKISWKGRTLAQMCADGLERRIWNAYVYLDGDDIVAYQDYKIRRDGVIELGANVCRKEEQVLSVSLIYLYELKFPFSKFFAGTYEENMDDIAIFEGAGFVPKKYYNSEIKEYTNKTRERITPKYLNTLNSKDLSYSLYFENSCLLHKSVIFTRNK